MVVGLLMKKNVKMFAWLENVSYICSRLTYGNAILFAKWGIVP